MAKSKGVLRQLTASKQNQLQRRHGSKPKSIKDRELKPNYIRPILRPERSWSQCQKIRVLVFLYHHRISINNLSVIAQYRTPTQDEASKIFGIPQTTISECVRKQNEIEKYSISSTIHNPRTVVICQWPELLIQLYTLFLNRREAGQAIRKGWFQPYADEIFRELYPNASTISSVFRFSNGWFEAFLRRYRVNLQCITKKTQKIPKDYYQLIVHWLQFNRRNSQPRPGNWMETVLCRAVGQYYLSNICNLDETPLPFEYLSGRTYNSIEVKTVWVKETRSGWDKRQASLVLCVFADGINRLPPIIIFHGLGERLGDEWEKYHPGVIVEFNEKAYMNDVLFPKYKQLHLIPVLEGRFSLFAIDLCTSHYTSAVLEKLRIHHIIPTLIPAGCTSQVQPLDVSINKPLKEGIQDLTDEAIRECERVDDFQKLFVSDSRVLTTCCVGDAWYEFCIENRDLVKRIFRKVGFFLPIDGSADAELDIKGFHDVYIGDWTRKKADNLRQFADVNREHDDNDVIEFIAYGE